VTNNCCGCKTTFCRFCFSFASECTPTVWNYSGDAIPLIITAIDYLFFGVISVCVLQDM
jgi:hypothetical protein